MTLDLKPWAFALSGSVAVTAVLATGAFYGLIPMLATAACLAVGALAGLVIGADVGVAATASQVKAVRKQITERDEALRAAADRIAELEQESAGRLAQGDEAAHLAESHLAALNRLRTEVAGG